MISMNRQNWNGNIRILIIKIHFVLTEHIKLDFFIAHHISPQQIQTATDSKNIIENNNRSEIMNVKKTNLLV